MHDMTHPYVLHDAFTRVTCLIHMCVWLTYMCLMTHSSVECDSSICMTWSIHPGAESLVIATGVVRVSYLSRWLIHICFMIYSYVGFMTYSYVGCDSFICVTWRIHMCLVTHSHLWHALFICVHDSIICVSWLIHLWDMTHPYAWHDALNWALRASSKSTRWQ